MQTRVRIFYTALYPVKMYLFQDIIDFLSIPNDPYSMPINYFLKFGGGTKSKEKDFHQEIL
jgi:hypothetical protein